MKDKISRLVCFTLIYIDLFMYRSIGVPVMMIEGDKRKR